MQNAKNRGIYPGQAIAGLILGIIGILLNTAMILFVILFFSLFLIILMQYGMFLL